MSIKQQLIDRHGQPAYGLFNDGVHDINYLDFDLRSTMDRRLGRWAKKLKFNQFQFIGLLSPQLIVGIAIVDLKIASNAFVYLYDPQTGEFDEFSFIQPLARGTHIDTRPNDGEARFEQGQKRFLMRATRVPGVRKVQVELPGLLSIDATIDESTAYQPLSICTRAGYQGWVFTQKSTALVCNGNVQWRARQINLHDIGALASVDWTAGFMRRETFWNWGSLSCRLSDGRRLGFNLAAGVNETGFTENAIWLDGKRIKVDMVDFRFDRYQQRHAWELQSSDGKIRLHFEPAGKRQEKMNAIIAASNFTQHFGRFFGEIRLDSETLTLNGEWGFTEDHYARW
ncbi:hypothetical protein CHH28_16825 [Bacterioplanes sanyensis]|uniref:DUF2804 domain-containing protein n=1 Tax=Bacterioplanes sanyensis TaxID=1249553 RepID=A0A222FNB2_9GAMM|nr:DUF2804 domain-containing protein [Bacterioplanes sanyensis]ASP40239.1 hypothetical protein CHH28_16825 [Bacterioplanes sanyensis]